MFQERTPYCSQLFSTRVRAIPAFLKSYKPDIVVMFNDHGLNASFVRAASVVGIPTLLVQDGILGILADRTFPISILKAKHYLLWRIISAYSRFPPISKLLAWSGWRSRAVDYGLVGATRIAVVGPFYKRLFLSKGVPERHLVVTGYPLLDDIISLRTGFDRKSVISGLGLPESAKVLLLATQPFVEDGILPLDYREKLLSVISRLADSHTDAYIVVRPHPRETVSNYVQLVASSMCPNLVLGDKFDTPHLVLASDCVLTVSSTVGLLAVAVGKPLIILRLFLPQLPAQYATLGCLASSEDELARSVDQILNGKERPERDESTILDHLSALDGKASSRVARLMQSMAAVRTNRVIDRLA